MAIRYDKKLRKQIDDIIGRYNNKVRRLKRSKFEGYIPDAISENVLKSMKKSATNRKDLLRSLKTYEDFTKRGGELNINIKGVSLPKYQHQAIKRYQSLIKRRLNARERFAKTTKETTLGQQDDFTIAQQFNLEYQNVLAKRERLINVNLSDVNPVEFIAKLEKNARTINLTEWQNNYLEMLDDVASINKIDKEKVNILKEKLKGLSPTQFDKLVKTERTLKQMIYLYKQIEDLGLVGAYMSQQEEAQEIFDGIFDNLDIIVNDYRSEDDLLGLK